MITLNLDWREVLWWMKGGMTGSHLCWNVYEDMVNRVWPQCSEQERRNLWLIMRRDLGWWWRPAGWSGFDLANAHGEGEWKPLKGYTIDRENPDGKPVAYIMDETPWMYFRQVLARFDPENQYAVTMDVESEEELKDTLRFTPKATIISCPTLITAKGCVPMFDLTSAPLTVRAYKWQEEYYIDWTRRCNASSATVARLAIPDDGTM
jgi:hypothetical protein